MNIALNCVEHRLSSAATIKQIHLIQCFLIWDKRDCSNKLLDMAMDHLNRNQKICAIVSVGIITISLLSTLILVLTLRKNNVIEYPDNDATSTTTTTSTAVPPTGATSESSTSTTTLNSQSTTLTSSDTSTTAVTTIAETTTAGTTTADTTTEVFTPTEATTTTAVDNQLLFVSDTQILEVKTHWSRVASDQSHFSFPASSPGLVWPRVTSNSPMLLRQSCSPTLA